VADFAQQENEAHHHCEFRRRREVPQHRARLAPARFACRGVIVQHRRPPGKSYLQEILVREAQMPVVTATSGDSVSPGVI
jgi:hypothetical protein